MSRSGEVANKVEASFKLKGNHPNPFNPNTTISYSLEQGTHAQLEVVNMLGQRVQIPVSEFQHAGHYEVAVDLNGLPSGTYLYRLIVSGQVQVGQMMLAK